MRRPREEAERADGIARIGNKMQERLEVTAFPVRGNIVDFFERGVEGEREEGRWGRATREGGWKPFGAWEGERWLSVSTRCRRRREGGTSERASERESDSRSWKSGGRGGRRRRRGRFFPIKQPAEFVFSPKRRCRFKVIDCHPGVGGGGGGGGGFRGGIRGGMRCGTVSVYVGEGIGTSGVCCRSFRSVSFRLVPVSLRYVTFARPCISSRNIGAE